MLTSTISNTQKKSLRDNEKRNFNYTSTVGLRDIVFSNSGRMEVSESEIERSDPITKELIRVNDAKCNELNTVSLPGESPSGTKSVTSILSLKSKQAKVVTDASRFILRYVLWMQIQSVRALHSMNIVHGDIHADNMLFFSCPSVFRTRFSLYNDKKVDFSMNGNCHVLGDKFYEQPSHISYVVPLRHPNYYFRKFPDLIHGSSESDSTTSGEYINNVFPSIPIYHNLLPQIIIIDFAASSQCSSWISCPLEDKISSYRAVFYNYLRLKTFNQILTSDFPTEIRQRYTTSIIPDENNGCNCQDLENCEFCCCNKLFKDKFKKVIVDNTRYFGNYASKNIQEKWGEIEIDSTSAAEVCGTYVEEPLTAMTHRPPEQIDIFLQKASNARKADFCLNDQEKSQFITNLSDVYSLAICMVDLIMGFTPTIPGRTSQNKESF